MNKKILIALFFSISLFSGSIFSKDLAIMPIESEAVVYKGVVDVGNDFTAGEIFNAAEVWLDKSVALRKIGGKQSAFMMMGGQSIHSVMAQLEADMRSRDKLLSKKEGSKLIYKFLQYYQAQKGLAVRTLLIDGDLTLQFKDGKYRYKLDGFDYQHFNHYTGSQNRIYAIGEKCSANGSLFKLQAICNKANGNRKKALVALDKDIDQFIDEMNKGIIKELTQDSDEEDW